MEADMAKLKLAPIADDKPVKVALELPASLHRDLVAYAEILGREAGHSPTDPVHMRDVDRRWVEWLSKYLGG